MKVIYTAIALICLAIPVIAQEHSSSTSTSTSESISISDNYSYSDSYHHPIADPVRDRNHLNGNQPLCVPEGGSSFGYLLLAGFACIGGVWYKRREVRN